MIMLSIPDPRNVRDGTKPSYSDDLERRIADAVRIATEPLHARIDHLARNRDSILREKRELEGRAVQAAEQRADLRPKAIDFAITRTQAKNPSEYRRAKDEAARNGFDLIILDDATVERRGEPPATFQSDTHYFVYAPSIKGDHSAYDQHKSEAQRLGLRFHVAYSAAEMPKDAFSGDAQ